MMRRDIMISVKCVTLLTLLGLVEVTRITGAASHDYGDALNKCILFFEGQRSGKLPSSQRMTWRKDSASQDGSDIGVDLVGGYYDAGDNIKFSFPMAFTTTMLAWSILEFDQFMGPELQHALDALRWGTDYLMKATSIDNKVVAQIGDPSSDHDCWERPEDMDTLRTTYVVNQTHPGSEVSAEIAAALAASFLVFKDRDGNYAKSLLERATKVFEFAKNYQGSYNSSVGEGVCPFYCDFNGYMDELVWGAAWLKKATGLDKYWTYVVDNIGSLEPLFIRHINGETIVSKSSTEFGWDAKHAGIYILVSPKVMNTSEGYPFITNADKFVCSIVPDSPTKSVTYSPGGLLFKPGGSNLQHPTALSFLLLVYAQYLKVANRVVHCGNVVADPSSLINIAKGQVDYILGTNPLRMSYMVGYSNKYPQRIHHRGSSLPSIQKHPQHLGCHDGDSYFKTNNPNQNLLVGALVGGPDNNDQYVDNRWNVSQSEPTTYINAPFVGVLAYFTGAN